MSDTEALPGGGDDSPMSMDQAIQALTQAEEPEDSTEQEEQPEETEPSEEAETTEDGQDDDQAEESGAEDEGQAEDEAEEEGADYAQGRFASDDAKVRLEDGSVVSIAQLKQGTLFQGDYTRKTQALSEERKAFEGERSRVQQLEQQLSEQRAYVQQFAQQLLPQEPDLNLMTTDPLGYMQAKAQYDAQVKHLNNIGAMSQQDKARRDAEQAQSLNEQRQQEAKRLLEVMPELRDQAKYAEFYGEASKTMASHYGFTAEEVAGSVDHRFYPIFRDLIAYQRMKASKPAVQQKTQGKPPVLKPGKRPSPEALKAQHIRAADDRLKKSGSVNDGVALLLAMEGSQ